MKSSSSAKASSVSPGNPVSTVVRSATSGTCSTKFLQQLLQFRPVVSPAHGGKNLIVHMLNGNIQVIANLLLRGHQADNLLRKSGGISIVKADPFQLYQSSQALAADLAMLFCHKDQFRN